MTRLRKVFFASMTSAVVVACGWDPSRPFDRESPVVNQALTEYDAGEAGSAAELLEEYLTTGACAEGNIGTPPSVRTSSNGSFDLGLALFKLAEKFGHRFGDEENDAGFLDPNFGKLRQQQVDCALRIVKAVAEDTSQPVTLRARARFLEGNLLFLTADYKGAVTAYEKALELIPAMSDAGPIGANTEAGAPYAVDPVGRDAAWNRAVALRRIEDKKDAGNDAAPNDGGNGEGGDNSNSPDSGSKDQNKDGGGDDKNDKDSGNSDDKGKDGGKDGGNNDKPKDDPNQNKEKEQPDAGAPPPPSRQNQDERILDQLENAPTVQQEAAKKQARQRRVKGTADK